MQPTSQLCYAVLWWYFRSVEKELLFNLDVFCLFDLAQIVRVTRIDPGRLCATQQLHSASVNVVQAASDVTPVCPATTMLQTWAVCHVIAVADLQCAHLPTIARMQGP